MPIYNGWTKEVSDKEREANRARAQAQIDLDRVRVPLCICLEVVGDNGDCPVHGAIAEIFGYLAEQEAQS